MCSAVTCRGFGETTWEGCGQHDVARTPTLLRERAEVKATRGQTRRTVQTMNDSETAEGRAAEASGDDRDDDALGAESQRERDTAYSPASERETEQLQREPHASPALDQGVDDAQVQTLPGTGGPDDSGATEPTQDDLDPAEIARRGERGAP